MNIKIGDKIFLKNQYGIPTPIIIVAIDKFGRYEGKNGFDTYMLDREFIENNVVNIEKVKYMNFIDAVNKLQNGDAKAIIRREYDDHPSRAVYIIHNALCKYDSSCCSFNIECILAEDWYVVKSEILYPFEEAIASLRKGKSIKRKAWINRFSVDADDNNYYFTIDDLNANDWIIKERN